MSAEPTIVADLLRQHAAANADRVAVVLDGVGSMTYGEWEARSNRLARALVEGGLQAGDRVALAFGGEASLDYLVSYQAVHKAGGVNVPVNIKLAPREVDHVLEHSEASVLLSAGGVRPRPVREGLTPSPAKIEMTVLEGDALRAAMRNGDGSAFGVPRGPQDLADILYTSGTTGLPKGVACSHESITYRGSSKLHEWFAGATFLHAVPLSTFAGTHAMTVIPLRGGMTHVLQPTFDAKRFLELIEIHSVAISYVVPAMVMRFLDEPAFASGAFDSLRLLMYGTAPMPPKAVRALGQAFSGTLLVNLYGLTEGGGAVCSLTPEEAQTRPDSIGKPVPPTKIRIVCADGQDAVAGAEGEIWLNAPVRRRSYYRDEAATVATWTEDGWLKTGDVGRLDADGFLYLVDRKKDLIIVGGHNVSAPEVEGVLLEHPAVREAAVVGSDHAILGEVPKAFVAVRDPVSADDLHAFVAERLADYKVPRDYEFVDELPRNALGKVLKRVLRGERVQTSWT